MTDTLKTLLAVFNLTMALAWLLLILFGFLSRGEPISSLVFLISWGCPLVGPALLFAGSLAFIRSNRRPRRGSFLAAAGALAVWCQARGDVPPLRDALDVEARGLTSWWVGFVQASLLTFFAAAFLYWDVPSDDKARRAQ
jgi:hypothetical protein